MFYLKAGKCLWTANVLTLNTFKPHSYTVIPSYTVINALGRSYGASVGFEPSLVPGRSQRAIWSPHRPTLHPPPVRPELIWHSTPTLHTCVPPRLDDGNDDTVIPVGGLFFQGWSTHTPPADTSEGGMLSGLTARYSTLVER